MICHLCQDDPCTCASAPLPLETPRAYKPAPVYDYTGALTKAQFGLGLFEAIKTNAARLQCETLGKTDKAKALQHDLQNLLTTLTHPQDVRRILEMR